MSSTLFNVLFRSVLTLLILALPIGSHAFSASFQEPITFDDDPEEDPEEDTLEDPERIGDNEELEPGEASPKMLEALQALERTPFDPNQLENVARLALACEMNDEALWYANLALEALGESSKVKKQRESLFELRSAIGMPGPAPEALQETYTKGLFNMAKACEKKLLYTNAAELLQLCFGTTMENRAVERLNKLFAKPKAVKGLLATGIPIEIPVAKRVNEKKRRKVDQKNTTWENYYEVKGKFYTVRSDMGYDYTHAFVDAMDQINGFYREVFNYKTRGGDMRTCLIDVYKSREEFDRYEGMKDQPNLGGFFSPSDNRVSTYDSRSTGGSLAQLWSTLFHEASHQFTAIVCPGLELAWLNEGTASYFEGAFLQPGGSVATNLIPDGRLRNLKFSLDQDSPRLKSVVTYYQPGSYDGSYYPFGWGLVYFMHNYEDENSERIYLPIYKKFLASYSTGGKHVPLERFVEYFVDKAKVEGVTTFEEFDEHWQAWIQNLYDLQYGGPDKAELLLARARKQIENGKLEYARSSLRWSLNKNAKHMGARLELAKVLTQMDLLDGAVYHWRHLESFARTMSDPEDPVLHLEEMTGQALRELAQKELTKINPLLGVEFQANVDRFVQQTLEGANSYAQADMPLAALHLLKASSRLISGDGRLNELSEEIRNSSEKELRRAYRIPVDPALTGWSNKDHWHAADSILAIDSAGIPGFRTNIFEKAPPLPYRLEVDMIVHDAERSSYAGLAFASSLGGDAGVAWIPAAKRVGYLDWSERGPEIKNDYRVKAPKGVRKVSDTELHLAIEVADGWITIFTNGKKVGTKHIPGGSLQGRVGVWSQNTNVEFHNLRLVY